MMVMVIMMIMVMTIMIMMIAMNEERWWLLYAHDGDNGGIDKKSDDNGAIDDDG